MEAFEKADKNNDNKLCDEKLDEVIELVRATRDQQRLEYKKGRSVVTPTGTIGVLHVVGSIPRASADPRGAKLCTGSSSTP